MLANPASAGDVTRRRRHRGGLGDSLRSLPGATSSGRHGGGLPLDVEEVAQERGGVRPNIIIDIIDADVIADAHRDSQGAAVPGTEAICAPDASLRGVVGSIRREEAIGGRHADATRTEGLGEAVVRRAQDVRGVAQGRARGRRPWQGWRLGRPQAPHPRDDDDGGPAEGE